MLVELVNKDPRYSKVHLIDPAPLGYLHLAAEVRAAHRPGPVLRRSRDKRQLFGVLKWQARQLAGLDAVERVTVYDAVVFAPPGAMSRTGPRRSRLRGGAMANDLTHSCFRLHGPPRECPGR